ncbi:EamA family transporter [Fischerella muscicola]|uniref:EamA family transporter n=1 Tax=Fischerella muscicola TaxID=92938 RepID=UPI0002E5B4B3|nr:EamA family transporter [Fischerella muscicola]
MGRFEKRSENSRAGETFTEADTALRAVTEELQIIQRTLLKSLQEDIKRLQTERLRLADDIKRLQEEKEELLQGRQLSELQVLLRQLANILASHISSQLQSSLETLAKQAVKQADESKDESNAVVNQLLGSLDDTLTITFNTLQQEVKNYQTNISRQLSQMSLQQQQGEEILAELVNRLRGELIRAELEKTTQRFPQQSPPTVIQTTPYPADEPTQQQESTFWETPPHRADEPTQQQESTFWETPPHRADEPTQQQESSSWDVPTEIETDRIREYQEAEINRSEESEVFASTKDNLVAVNSSQDSDTIFSMNGASPSEQVTAAAPSRRRRNSSVAPMGLLLILVSTVVISLYNVAIKVIFNSTSLIFGVFEVEGLLAPTLGNSLLILMLRMLVVVPLMLVLAPILYPQVWQDLQSLVGSRRTKSTTTNAKAKQVLLLSIVSGCFLFLSQVLIYIAISQIATGVAIALMFVYPAISGLLAWSLLKEQPTSLRLSAIASIFLGQMLILAGDTSIGTGNAFLGSITAVVSGIAFAFYVILTNICASKVHPVPFTLINFATMLVLSFVGLIIPLPTTWSLQVNSNKLLELILSAFILGVLTLFSHVFNNVGIRKLGATRSAILGATVPVITVILAGLIIQETLLPAQVLGVLFVTGGAAAVSYEKMRNRTKRV